MKLPNCRFALALACALPLLAQAATPRPNDYVEGMSVETSSERPVVQLTLPDSLYQTVVTDDLSDVRVFNADGIPVQHALCAAPTQAEATVSQETLPVFQLQDAPARDVDGTRVEVQTPSGAQISVAGDRTQGDDNAKPSAHVIDARGVDDELRAVQFDWSSPDGASEARVRIQASDDLDEWQTIVGTSTLLRIEQGGQELRRHRVTMPQQRYQYLRVERVDRGPSLTIVGVIAERVTPAPVIEPIWFYANPASAEQPNELLFDAAHRAPITYARLVLAQDNTSLQIAVESRDDEKAMWRTQWTGEAYSIVTEAERRVSPPAEFVATYDRYWRVRLTKQHETFLQVPSLELGYRPAQLRFLAQGAGPFTLAYGSRRADPAPASRCDNLLAALKREELADNIGDGIAGEVRALGGDDALRPLPKQTPLRQIVLWGVLVIGVGVLIAMALSLLKRVKNEPKG